MPSDNIIVEKVQLSFVLGENFLISFQEKKSDYFNHIRERIRKKIGVVRERGTDYLLFLLIESVLDNYFESISEIESDIVNFSVFDIDKDPSPNVIKSIELYKRHVHIIKKTVIPLKDFINKMEREKFNSIEEINVKYYYELKDLCLSLIDSCDHIDIQLESSTNLFFSIQGHRTNQVMKTLTIVATIFIPLTFLVGIYGMNFNYMPELNLKWGYLGIWIIMFLILLGMIYYFKKKKWF